MVRVCGKNSNFQKETIYTYIRQANKLTLHQLSNKCVIYTRPLIYPKFF